MKVWLIVAASLIVAGLMLFAVVMTVNHWDFSNWSTVKYETNEHTVTEPFDSIRITTETADISFLPSEDDSVRVVCIEETKANHAVFVEDGTLTVSLRENKKWYDHIQIGYWGTPSVTVYLPAGEYASLDVKASTSDVTVPDTFKFETIDIKLSTGDTSLSASATGHVSVKASTGHILCEDMSTGSMSLTASTGKITLTDVTCSGDIDMKVTTGKNFLENVTCRNLTTEGDTGDITLTDVIASGTMEIERSTGDVTFEGCDAKGIEVETETGNVKGSFLTEKIFYANTDTGKVDIARSTKGDLCEVETDTGDITLWIAE